MGEFIVVPAFNEQFRLGQVLDNLKKEGYRNIVVVDDGSTDHTFDVAKKRNVHALRHVVNRGQGAAIKTGIDYALQKGADTIITFDSDGQHSAKDIKRLLNTLKKNKLDIVLGSRFLTKSSNVPPVRKIVLKGGSVVLRAMYGVPLTDSHNGLRAFTARTAKRMKLRSDKMEHASEFIEEISRLNLKYKEVPVTITYTAESMKKGQSSFNAFNILFKMIMKKLVK